MNIVVLSLLLMAAGDATEFRKNPVLNELITKGIAMPEGTVIKLPPPLLGKEMDAAAQRAAIEKILPRHCTFEDFTAQNSQAPLTLKNRPLDKKGYTLRKIDVYFVARGRWNVLSSKEFGDTILKKKKEEAKKDAGSSMTAGFLTDKEMAKRKLKSVTEKHWGDRYFYSTFCLFDMVEVSATRYVVLSETPDGVVIAGRIDPQFDKDKEYPNQWRRIDKDALGKPVLGPKQPYAGTGFYLKATRLKAPEEAIFFEIHAAFNEPEGWFDGAPTLSAQLAKIINFKVKDFRGNLARASEEAKEKAEEHAAPAAPTPKAGTTRTTRTPWIAPVALVGGLGAFLLILSIAAMTRRGRRALAHG